MTNLTRYNPVLDLQREVQRMFDDLFPVRRAEGESAVWSPSADLAETPDAYQLRLDLPGLRKEDVTIAFENGVLQVSGERKIEREGDENPQYHRMERWYGRFFRSMRFERPIDAAAIRATFADGVLTVDIPKAEESKPRRIEIQ